MFTNYKMIKKLGFSLFSRINGNLNVYQISCIHVCNANYARVPEMDRERCTKWMKFNDKVYPPQAPDEPRRPAYVCHVKTNLKYSYERMWYIACFIRGMTISEALKQLGFVQKKGAQFAIDTLLEAQDLAVKEHNVEFKTNLWVSESFVGKSFHIKGMRRHAKMRMGEIRYGYIHYFVTLEEGTPPEHYYYHNRPRTGEELFSSWLNEMRTRRVITSL